MDTAEPKDKKQEVAQKKEPERKIPLCRVIVHADKGFVPDKALGIIMGAFRMDQIRAAISVARAEDEGHSLVAEMHLELAELRVIQANALARKEGQPITFSIERPK